MAALEKFGTAADTSQGGMADAEFEGLRQWKDPALARRDNDDDEAPTSGLLSEQAGYMLRRNSSVLDRLKAFAKVLKPTDEDATDTPSDTHTQEHAAEQHVAAGALGAGDKERQRNTPANNGDKPRLRRPVKARPTSSAGRPQTKRRAATAPAHSKRSGPRAQKASGYNFPRWLSQRSDFESLRQEQRNCGPSFVRQALTTPGFKRRGRELDTLVKWLGHNQLFKHLHERQLRVIAKSLSLSKVMPGQTLYPEKRVAYFVLSGLAHVQRPGDPPVTVKPGQALGARFWWAVVSREIHHRDSQLGRRMSQILLQAEALQDSTAVDGLSTIVDKDEEQLDRKREALRTTLAKVRTPEGSMLGAAPIRTGSEDGDRRGVSNFNVAASMKSSPVHQRRHNKQLQAGNTHGHGSESSGQDGLGPMPSFSKKSTKRRFASFRADRRQSFFDSAFSATAVPAENGGSEKGLELVRLSMGDYVESLAEERKRTQAGIVKFLHTVNYFQTWTSSRLLVLAGLLEQRNIAKGREVFKQGDSVNGLCILMQGKCKLMKRVKVQRKHKWPVGSKRWSVQKKNFEWDVEIKEVLPRAIIGEEATLISKKHRLALVSNYFSNAFLEQRSASHSGLRALDPDLNAMDEYFGGSAPELETKGSHMAKTFKTMVDSLVSQHSVRSMDGASADKAATRAVAREAADEALRNGPHMDADANSALRQAANALSAVMAKQRPYSVVAAEDSVILFLRPEHFACLYHTELMPKLRKLARNQATHDAVVAAEEVRRSEAKVKRDLREKLVGDRYYSKLQRRPGDPTPPPPQGPLLDVPRTENALQYKSTLPSGEDRYDAYMKCFKYESKLVKKIREEAEQREAQEFEAQLKQVKEETAALRLKEEAQAAAAERALPQPRPGLDMQQLGVMPDDSLHQHNTRPASASRRLRLGSARPPSAARLRAGWGTRSGDSSGWSQYLTVSPNRVVVRVPSSNGARPKTPATVVSGAFPPRPAASPFSPPVEDQLHHLAHETRESVKNRPNTATGTPAHRRVKREHSPDVRRGSAYNQAQKSGVITPKVTDVMLITGPKERVEKPRNTKVDASSLAGATRHHLWEQGNIDAASDVPYRLSLPYPTDVFQRQARHRAVAAAQSAAQDAAGRAASVSANRTPPRGQARGANSQHDRGGAGNAPSRSPQHEVLARDYQGDVSVVASRMADDAVYDDLGWWASRKVANSVNEGLIRGDTVETIDQLQKRLRVKLRWRPVKQFHAGGAGKTGFAPPAE